MEDSSLFSTQWMMNTLQQDGYGQAIFPSLQLLNNEATYASERAQELPTTEAQAAAAKNWSSSGATHGSGSHILAAAEAKRNVDAWPPPADSGSCREVPTGGSSSGRRTNLPVSWNFWPVSSEPSSSDSTLDLEIATDDITRCLPKLPPPPKSTSRSLAPYASGHIIAERKRREKISQRFVELSAVIPGLKKMDKATILADATRYVKELQEKLNARREVGSGVLRSSGGVVVKNGSLSGAPAVVRKSLPEIHAEFSGNDVMVRVLCRNGKRVAARVLAEVEKLHLSIIVANVSPFPACTLNITITAKVEVGFIVTAEEIIGRVSSALSE